MQQENMHYFKLDIGKLKNYHTVWMSISAYLKNGTIFEASISAVLNPWEYNMTWAMSWRSGFVMARLKETTKGHEIQAYTHEVKRYGW